MTDFSSLFTTTSLPNPFPVTTVPAQQSPLLNGTLSDNNLQEEEEYTIKCICGYIDDDGNTVYCPKCDTWQHIECYYPTKKVPEEHYCGDCVPRDNLDAKRAAERQRRHREALDGSDRKIKRPPTTKTKKKHKDSLSTTEQINGWHMPERHDSLTNGRDQPPPAKKPKTNHRPSGSVVSINGNGETTRKRATSNVQGYPSPSKSPQEHSRYAPVPLYSPEFLDLYERDEGSSTTSRNEPTVQAMRVLFSWRNNPSLVTESGQQPNSDTPFIRAPQSMDVLSYPPISVESIQRKEVEIDGKIPTWKYIQTHLPITKDQIVGEIRGEVGILPEYCQQESTQNRWNELKHPDPFVFFHPHVDIYIDMRKEGTPFRYLRRSCSPNVTLKTFVSDDGDIRHCFVARHDVPAGRELTAAWFVDPNMMLSGHANGEQEESPFSRQADWVSRVLSNFGDCACSAGANCYFEKFDRRILPKPLDGTEKARSGRKRKQPKSKPAISPMSTGQATNSRAGSEALKQEDEDQNDHRSTSDSSSSEPKSRDMTPTNLAALDAPPVLGSDLTAREIRKIKAMEKMFEQGGSAKKEKKKRTSGGSNLNTPSANASKHSPYNLTDGLIAADHFSGSPPPRLLHQRSSKPRLTQQKPSRPLYTSVAVQTDPEKCDFEMPPPKRRKFLTPTQKLLRKVFADRAKWEQDCKKSPVSPLAHSASVFTPTPSQDVEMKDAATGLSPTSSRSAPLPSPSTSSDTNPGSSPNQSPVYPLPSQAAHSLKQFKVPPAPKLQLSTLPPVPSFTTATSASTLSLLNPAPGVTTPSTMQSPVLLMSGSSSYPGLTTTAVMQSPAKKKLSLGDYMSRRYTNSVTTPLTEKPPGQTTPEQTRKDSTGSITALDTAVSLKPDKFVREEAAAQGGLSGSAVDDAVMRDDADEPEYVPPEPIIEELHIPSETPKIEPSIPIEQPASTLSKEKSAEVSSVLASLTALHEKHRSQSAGSPS